MITYLTGGLGVTSALNSLFTQNNASRSYSSSSSVIKNYAVIWSERDGSRIDAFDSISLFYELKRPKSHAQREKKIFTKVPKESSI